MAIYIHRIVSNGSVPFKIVVIDDIVVDVVDCAAPVVVPVDELVARPAAFVHRRNMVHVTRWWREHIGVVSLLSIKETHGQGRLVTSDFLIAVARQMLCGFEDVARPNDAMAVAVFGYEDTRVRVRMGFGSGVCVRHCYNSRKEENQLQ